MIFFNAILFVIALMTFVWILSLIKKDASIADIFWGSIFVLLCAFLYAFAEQKNWRQLLVLVLVFIWGIRLSVHIYTRNRGRGEDVRYRRMREKHGNTFWWYSFFSVFLLQGILAILISAPLFAVQGFASPEAFQLADALGILLWATGFTFEAGSDYQLRKFKSVPENKGKLLTSGFWSLTRHPNYFGDACIWWGFYCFALSVDYGWSTFIGPVLMTLFLRYVSGVTLLEKDLSRTKPGFQEYIATTPAFFPRLWSKKEQQ